MSNLGDQFKKAIAAASIAAAVAVAPVGEAKGAPAPATVSSPLIRFDPSQRRLFDDQARIIVVNWHRQKGKDFTAAAKAVDEALRTHQSWYIVALTQAQADETFAKCKKVAAGFKKLLKLQGNITESEEDFTDRDKEIDEAFQCTARILHLPGGGRVVSLPGKNPDTLAGRTGNMILTEFGLYPKGGYEHWDVLFPIITRGGFKLIIISTPRGRNTKFYEIFSNPHGDYSVHLCDIVRSVFEDGYQIYDARGLPLPQRTDEEKHAAIATLERLYNSPSKWPREYLCQFTGDLSALITWAEIQRAAALGKGLPFDHLKLSDSQHGRFGDVVTELRKQIKLGSRLELGWDVARKGNISAVMANLSKYGQPRHLRFALGMKNCEYAFMRGAVMTLMNLQAYSVGHGDATGLGNDSNETLTKLYPDRWTAFMFTTPGKRDLASGMKTAFVDGAQTLPDLVEHKVIASDIYAIQRDDTGSSMTLEETANPVEPDSHCDYAYGLGLSLLAGSNHFIRPLPVGPERRPLNLR